MAQGRRLVILGLGPRPPTSSIRVEPAEKPMLLFAPRQRDPDETRTPITPAVVKKLRGLGLDVAVEPGLGTGAFFDDAAFTDAGATLAGDGQRAWEDADVVVTLGPPEVGCVQRMKDHAALVGLLAPTVELGLVRAAAQRRVSMVSLEFVPRISRAQAMDALSSQANLAGYKAVLLGVSRCPKLMPMMITAAGTLAPGRVFVLGVGVAGLQAIATAKRLGAIVEAYDIRPATKEQVLSLGARFVELPAPENDESSENSGGGSAETAGGYAKEQTDEQRQQQAELMAKHVAGADVVVTTAAVFGKAPPVLIPADVVAQMKPGSVVVDLAANPAYPAGRCGNCELTRPGEVFETDGRVTLVGTTNLPGTLPVHASEVLANNIHALLKTMIAPESAPGNTQGDGDGSDTDAEPRLHLDLDDEIHTGALVTHAGEVVDDLVKSLLDPAPGTSPGNSPGDTPGDNP